MNDNLESIIRIGTVSSVNTSERTARVKFAFLDDLVSGSLRVLQRPGTELDIKTADAHTHPDSKTTFWMPKVGDTVLCIYEALPNGSGVIVGVL